MRKRVAVVGLGEVGRPMATILSRTFDIVEIDLPHPPLETLAPVDVMHVCLPFEIDDFEGQVLHYARGLQPGLIIIDSTVSVGTTRRIHESTGAPAAHSPVRGKHTKMVEDLEHYTKHVGGVDPVSTGAAAEHLRHAGFKVLEASSSETTELAKLTETTYFGLLISWAQQVERYCDTLGLSYDEVAGFYQEIAFFPPVKFFPGVIGGHCVIPNLAILEEMGPTDLTQAILRSNSAKIAREARASEE